MFYKFVYCLSFLLTGCGFQPLIQPSHPLPGVYIDSIANRQGQQLRTFLQKHFPNVNPKYRLTVQLKQNQTSIAVESNALTSRYQLRLTASYKLSDFYHPERFVTGTVDSLGSFNMLSYTNYIQGSSEFSNLVSAEATADRALTVLSEELALHIQAILVYDPELKQEGLLKKTAAPEEILGLIQEDQGETGFTTNSAL